MRVAEGVHLFTDTCNVYVLVRDRTAVLIDFGSGRVLDHLAEFGADRVAAVLMTHHHRDQGQGLHRAAAAGIPIWVPPVERDLFDSVDEHWARRTLDNNYDLRQDRFSLLEPVPVHDVVPEYRTRRFGGFDIRTLPTPGHTLGSVSYLTDVEGRRLAFTGDLVYGEGRTWSVSAYQWSYSGLEGAKYTVLSLAELGERDVDLALPSHGAPITRPVRSFALLASRLRQLVDSRRDSPWEATGLRDRPYERISPHLLRNRSSFATNYVLLSDSGNALFLDFGYDLVGALPVGDDRSSRRPLLASLRALRAEFGVDRVEVAVPTHYHDDHVAGFNLLREVEGTEIWSAASVAGVLTDPWRHDLPCLWYDPIAVDRIVPVGEPVRWHEYELSMYPLPGHTLYAVAIAVQVDGRRVLATGDQQDGGWADGERTEILNFQYRNRFRIGDFVDSALLYQRLQPELMISGHWPARVVDDAYLKMLLAKGEELERLHRELLPLHEVDFGAEGFGARIHPYRAAVAPGQVLELAVEAVNPLSTDQPVSVTLVLPHGWEADPPTRHAPAGPGETVVLPFRVRIPTGGRRRRMRLAADLTVGERRFGQHAEALVDVAVPLPRGHVLSHHKQSASSEGAHQHPWIPHRIAPGHTTPPAATSSTSTNDD